MEALLSDLPSRGVKRLDLALLRPDSTGLGELAPAARRLGLAVECEERDLTQEMNLPATWEDYLLGLDGKQRHELRRKLRRLEEAGRSRFRMVTEETPVSTAMDRFLELFRSGRPDKVRFMTPVMADYFRALAKGLAANGMLRLGCLDLNGQTVAVVFCFQLGETMYLYNNAFDDRFRALGVGLISKLLSIRAAIEAGAARYDFLRGAENYKRLLGGRPTPLYRCRITLCGGPDGGQGPTTGGGKP
jgi:CelD/BcsL family acetyltransferase involved in cellulose biosynthesis